MESTKIEFTDRYSATGTPPPDKSSCGWCEGMGVSPLQKAVANATAVQEGANGRLIIIGQREKDGTPGEEDSYLFVRCPECFGTRKKNSTDEEKRAQLLKDFNL